MGDLAKILFFFIAIIFIGSILNDADISFGNNGYSGDGPAPRDTYLRSYDRDGNGVVSDSEYTQGESKRIEQEILDVQVAVVKALREEIRSPYADYIQLRSGNMRTDDRYQEYVTLRASDDLPSPIDITGWKLQSLVTGRGERIGRGVVLLDPTRPWRFEKDIFLAPGEKAIITSGSPVGINTSFTINSCTGYLEERRNFHPSLPRQCPLLEDENLSEFGLAFNDFDEEEEYDECIDAIERIGSCEISSGDNGLVSECRRFIREYANYEGCYELHANDRDFIKSEWRIFLGAGEELWREEREAVALYDNNNLVVGVIEY